MERVSRVVILQATTRSCDFGLYEFAVTMKSDVDVVAQLGKAVRVV